MSWYKVEEERGMLIFYKDGILCNDILPSIYKVLIDTWRSMSPAIKTLKMELND